MEAVQKTERPPQVNLKPHDWRLAIHVSSPLTAFFVFSSRHELRIDYRGAVCLSCRTLSARTNTVLSRTIF